MFPIFSDAFPMQNRNILQTKVQLKEQHIKSKLKNT